MKIRNLLFLMAVLVSGAGALSLDLPLGEDLKINSAIQYRQVYFNSRDAGFKSLTGPVGVGKTVTMTIAAGLNDLDRVSLCVARKEIEGNNTSISFYAEEVIPLSPQNTGGRTLWQGDYTFAECGVYGYYFVLEKGSQTLYYGNNTKSIDIPYVEVIGTGGQGQIFLGAEVAAYNQTVYAPSVAMNPLWQDQVIYYVFPERFKNGDKKNDPTPGKDFFYGKRAVEFHKNWSDPKPWVPGNSDGNLTDDAEYNNDFYGGDLTGLIQKLDYLKSLGVTLIYMTPIFTAPSSHKYDTADYKQIDPHFGDLEVFKLLVSEAKKRGIGLILDASLNHTGSDSVYMDRYGKYPGTGAYENETVQKNSPYYDWYTFTGNKEPSRAYSQWANETLATLAESPSWKKFAFEDADSVTNYWLSQGIAGWRMDVTPWKSDDFWRQWRTSLKKSYPQAMTYCEVWFDASKYLTGDMFDASMNYIFRGAALGFARGSDAQRTREAFEMLQESYPRETFYRMMNLTSSHDVPRQLYELGYKNYGQANYAQIRPRDLLLAAMKFTLPGSPALYYGEEVGMTGGADPFCRGPFPWKEEGADYGDWKLAEDYKKLSQIRTLNRDILARGDLIWEKGTSSLLSFRRMALNGASCLVVMNNSQESQKYLAEAGGEGDYQDLWRGGKVSITAQGVWIEPLSFKILLKEKK